MVNLGDVPVDNALKPASDESSSSLGVENLELVELLYTFNFPILASNASHCSSGSELDSFSDKGDSFMS